VAGVFDSQISIAVYADEEITRLFSDEAFITTLIAVESQLAQVQEELGVIPAGYGRTISRCLDTMKIDPAELSAGYAKDGIAVPALVAILRRQLPADVSSYLHWGATSQDIMDSALSLRLKSAVPVFMARISELIELLAGITQCHRRTFMLARTRGQAAAPTVFGLKTATWLAPLLRQKIRLTEMLPRLLVLQYGGAVGTLAMLGPDGRRVHTLLAERLGLYTVELPWHAQRDNLVEFANWLTMTAGVIGKIGQDMLLMSQSEIAEISFSDSGGSSSMPHKANPVVAETLVAIARHCFSESTSMQQAMVLSHERDGVGMTLEALAFPNLVCSGAASLKLVLRSIETMQVNTQVMGKNLAAMNGVILAEAATSQLSQFMDRDQAAALVSKACVQASSTGSHMIDELRTFAQLNEIAIDWPQLKLPENHLGAADDFISVLLNAILDTDKNE